MASDHKSLAADMLYTKGGLQLLVQVLSHRERMQATSQPLGIGLTSKNRFRLRDCRRGASQDGWKIFVKGDNQRWGPFLFNQVTGKLECGSPLWA